ncbi:MAG: sugar transferase [Erysipelotrichales bacterium]|nr:sugar transferase [Erysipelotrichales bacterium]
MSTKIEKKLDTVEVNSQTNQYVKLKKSQKIYLFLRNICDRIIAFLVILLLLPLWLILALTIRYSSKGSAIFKQKRVGRNRKQFDCYKWRSLRADAPKYMAHKDFDNINNYETKVGAFIRKTSIDELAQLFNILKGDMSIIGYRPLISQEIDEDILRASYGIYQIRPGMSGWAQVSDRETKSAEEKVKMDLYYLQHVGLWIDIKIFFKTIFALVGGLFKRNKNKSKERKGTQEAIEPTLEKEEIKS